MRRVWIGGLVLVVLAVGRADDPKKPAGKAAERGAVELKLSDGSTVRAVLTDEKIDVMTRYGKLSVPVADVLKIDFAPRLAADAVKKLETTLANLSSPTEKTRDDAIAELLRYGPIAVPGLMKLARGSDQEVAARARDLLERIRESLNEEKLVARDEDAIHTEGFVVVGKLETQVLKARTGHFGELTLKVTDLRGLRAAGYESETVVVNAQPDPGSMTQFNNMIGKTFYFTVTGANSGSLYGTGVHTTDSSVATAAVHGGILKVGQTGVVKVSVIASPAQFIGSTQHGITSSGWGQYTAAFKVSKP